ncbi:LysE family translocator [Candidatus Uabimicrobium amorphum]|uniref:Threonine transporter RhtB n=1 Tax=Uabimicrobium amorphum TaxID=2596890 RepID=A0A5S9F4F7_UABAM|nr:LysE family translocator [Candidatus Uabimicrobium amorphum]BBM85502.1 threonine transporter RhtB [Candidatus Uabimicrobium amorphum]
MTFENVFAFATISFMVAVSPGASWVYVIQSTMHSGQHGGFAAILGNAIGILLHAVLAFLGLAIFVQLIPQLFFALKLCGAIYLIYIGIKNIFYAQILSLKNGKKNIPSSEIVRDGILMNLLNPKVSILMIALLPQFIDVANDRFGALYLGSLHALIASIVLSGVSLLTKSIFTNERNRYYLVFSWLSGIVLCIFAVQLLLFDVR